MLGVQKVRNIGAANTHSPRDAALHGDGVAVGSNHGNGVAMSPVAVVTRLAMSPSPGCEHTAWCVSLCVSVRA